MEHPRSSAVRRSSSLLACVALVLLAVVACGSSDDRGGGNDKKTTSTTGAPTSTTTPVPTAEQRLASLQFRPVRSSGPCPAGTAAAEDDGSVASVPVTTIPSGSDADVPDRTGTLCYAVGPAGGDGTDLNAGRVEFVDGRWRMNVYPKALSIPDLEAMFDACFRGTSDCPAGEGGHGYVAIVWDGRLVSAESVSTAGMGSQRFQLAADFTDSQAEELATLLPV